MLERTTQQLLEAKATRTDLLESIATLTRESENAAARVREVEEQIRQEVAAKEYLGLELHKAEGQLCPMWNMSSMCHVHANHFTSTQSGVGLFFVAGCCGVSGMLKYFSPLNYSK